MIFDVFHKNIDQEKYQIIFNYETIQEGEAEEFNDSRNSFLTWEIKTFKF